MVLESNPGDLPTLEKIFRIAHNIKGSSRAVGFESLGVFTHEFESFLLKCKNGLIPINERSISLLLKCNDHVRICVDQLKADLDAVLDSAALMEEIKIFESAPSDDVITAHDVRALEAAISESVSEHADSRPDHVEPLGTDPFAELEATTAQALTKVAPVVKAAASPVNSAGGDESIRVSLARLEKLLNFVGELVILQTVLREQAYAANPQNLRRTVHQIGKVTKEVQDLSMSLRMVPLKQTFQKMQRIVRDTSQVLGKKVNLVLEGEDTEVDKTVLESLSDPLVHLIRNAVDHGVENPADRLAKGKPEAGTVHLRAFHQSGRLVIEVKDNGGGISGERLAQKAAEKGILRPGQTLTEKESIHLIFHPGFSTKAQVTEVSGRGVGMDVVKTNIEQMQGEILVDTVLGEGSTFKIVLPLTLAIIEGMIVRSGEEKFVIPLTHVHESVKIDKKDLKFATGIGEVLLLRGENIPAVRLTQLLDKGKKIEGSNELDQIAIVVRTQGEPFAVLVNDIIGQHEVVVKKLGTEVQHLRGYSGSAILGDGKPALILELSDLIQQNNGKRQAA